MKRRPLLFFLALLLAPITRAAEDSPVFVVQNDSVPAPAGRGARAPRLTRSPDGAIYLTWIEQFAGKSALRFASYQPAARSWSPARTATEATGDYAFAAGPGNRLASLVCARDALVLAESADAGATWGKPVTLGLPATLTPSSPALEFLADGRLLTVWTVETPAGGAELHAHVVKGPSPTSDHLIETRVSPGSAPAIVAFPDGGALVVYRGCTETGVQDIRTARYNDNAWPPPTTLISDLWKPASAPMDGPALAARGPHLAAAWFTGADGTSVQVSVSSNAGRQWLMPNRVDDVSPLGRPSLVLLDDGSSLAAWVEQDGSKESVLLRRVSSRGTLSVPVRIAQGISGRPHIVRVKDGDATPAQLLLACTPAAVTPDASAPSVITRLITLPSPAQLAETDACDCDPRPEEQRGFALQGKITAIDFDAGTLTVAHEEIPGLMKAATTTFKAGPEVLVAAQPGKRVFARTERIGPDWWLFGLRTLAAP